MQLSVFLVVNRIMIKISLVFANCQLFLCSLVMRWHISGAFYNWLTQWLSTCLKPHDYLYQQGSFCVCAQPMRNWIKITVYCHLSLTEPMHGMIPTDYQYSLFTQWRHLVNIFKNTSFLLWPSDALCKQRFGVNIGSVNGLLPDGNKPLPEPMLTDHQWSPVTFILGQIHKRCLNHQSLKSVWKLHD